MGVIMHNPFPQFFDDNGDPLNGGKLYTYTAGTTTPKATYQEEELSNAHANPIVLDAYGRPPAAIYGSGNYKFVLKTSADVTIWTADDIDLLASDSFGATLLATATAAAARTALGLGTAAIEDVGTAIGDVVQLESVGGSAGLPAVDGSQLTGVTASQVTDLDTEAAFHRSYLAGLQLSNNGADANNDIDIAVGECRDGADSANMVLASALTKQLDAAWAVGTNQGGLDAGSKATNTWYFVFLIRDPTNDVVDVLFSTSATSPTMPTNYTKKRRLGAILTDASGNIIAFDQWGDEFLWDAGKLDVDVTNLGTTATLYTLDYVPDGFKVEVIANMTFECENSSAPDVLISCPDISDQAPDRTAAPLCTFTPYENRPHTIPVRVRTNTSAQIRARSSIANTKLKISITGWIDRRGRDD